MSAHVDTEFPGIALITGAGGTGIGSACAHAFLRAGCTKLVITDLNPSTLEFTLTSLRGIAAQTGLYTTIFHLVGDISDPAFVDRLFYEIQTRFGRLDYAVNCAGIIGNNLPTDDCSAEDWHRVNEVNYKGVFLCSRKELGMMKNQAIRERAGYGGERRQRGAIVNIASQLGIVGRSHAPLYCASKHAVIGLTKCDAIDYSQFQIRINAVCPGIINTPMNNAPPRLLGGDVTMGDVTPARTMDLSQVINVAPMKRMGTPMEVADVVLFLCSERASFVQGASWVVDGGYTIN